MYRIIVGELDAARAQTGALPLYGGWKGKPLMAQKCRISALSSADYCLRDREEMDWGKICWKGNKKEILRLFAAERLNDTALRNLDGKKEYGILFLGSCRTGCA